MCCFFNDTATTEIYTLSLHDALPISLGADEILLPMVRSADQVDRALDAVDGRCGLGILIETQAAVSLAAELARRPLSRVYLGRSEEHTSELQSRQYLVCRLLLEHKTD